MRDDLFNKLLSKKYCMSKLTWIIILVVAMLVFVIFRVQSAPSYKFWRMMQKEHKIAFRYFSDSPNWMVMDHDMGKIEGWHGPYLFKHSNVTFHCYCLGSISYSYLEDYLNFKREYHS